MLYDIPYFNFDLSLSVQQSVVSTRSVVIRDCDLEEDVDLTECDTSALDECSSDDVGWVQCSRSGRS